MRVGKTSNAPEGLGEQNDIRRGQGHKRGLNRGAGKTETRKESRTKGGDGSTGKQSKVRDVTENGGEEVERGQK